jgi:beta-glucosidase
MLPWGTAGGGPQKDGEDSHFPYGREQIYPGDMFDYHLEPFIDAIYAGVAAVMPYYSLPVGVLRKGLPIEEVGFAFNRDVITGILREELGFDGVVCTDFGVINPYVVHGHEVSPARAWGVEHLTPAERIAKALQAGCDQFGGESCVEVLVELVEAGEISEKRLDESVERLLRVKFELGLFDDPYADEGAAGREVGTRNSRKAGFRAQMSSLVLITNDSPVLPLGQYRPRSSSTEPTPQHSDHS